MLGICGFGGAAGYMQENLQNNFARLQELRKYANEHLSRLVKLNEPESCVPYIINFTLPDIKSETMLHYLSSKGIFVSSGSACSSNHAKKASHVLLAYGLSERDADSSLRVSLSEENTKDDIDCLVEALSDGIASLAKSK
jgi:cysteine desulfurase